ncbi:MAG: hypothetical protein JXA37_10045 [Chloroflexia bacterium]|nr:hypothetical protein [Chloroflexia bacterium]
MANRVEWIEHKGERIIFCDFSDIQDEEEMVRWVEEMEAEVLQEAPGTMILMLVDVTNSRVTSKMTERARAVAAAARERGIPSSPTAVVGITNPAKKAILLALQFLRPDLHAANSIEEAKDWLLERAAKWSPPEQSGL